MGGSVETGALHVHHEIVGGTAAPKVVEFLMTFFLCKTLAFYFILSISTSEISKLFSFCCCHGCVLGKCWVGDQTFVFHLHLEIVEENLCGISRGIASDFLHSLFY